MVTRGAAYAGKAIMKIPAVKVVIDGLLHIAPPITELSRIALIPDALQCLEVILNQPEVRALSRPSWNIGASVRAAGQRIPPKLWILLGYLPILYQLCTVT
jgi:hypothetical protein